MKLSQTFWKTHKEVPADAQITSHVLMVRAGLIHKAGAGLYNYLVLAQRSIRKVEEIVRQEMDKVAGEVYMSVVTPGELWKESGRWQQMDGLLRAKDKRERDLCISPTNEEAVVDIFRSGIKSYKQLPLSLYQINIKFRDEIRPRFGLMRGREFTMKDAYSFHVGAADMDRCYQQFYDAYCAIFTRLGLNFTVVEADAGAIGDADSKTHEFQVVADSGEDEIIYCPESGWAANIEAAKTIRSPLEFASAAPLEEVHTPGMGTIEDVCDFLKTPQYQSIKSLVYMAIEGESASPILAQLLGDDSLNEIKLKNFLGCDHVVAASDREMADLGFVKGFIGGYKLEIPEVKIVLDSQIDQSAAYTAGANRKDYHYTGLVPERDIADFTVADIRLARVGDLEPQSKEVVEIRRGIEVGHVFQLGDKYTRSMNVTVQGQDGKPVHPTMGCYGIGITRIVAAAVEQNHDDKGIVWPAAIAPLHVHFILLAKSDQLKALAREVYEELWSAGVETLLDDRDVGVGFKFKDADLLGLPWQLVLGERDYGKDGKFKLVWRKSGEELSVSRDELVATLKARL